MNRVTNRQLRELLRDLGFESRGSVEPKCFVLEHPKSKARLLLPSNKDDEEARFADILSIRTHLVYRGHLDDEQFERFIENGQLRAL
ncbi:MAG: hypothetical protein MUF25_26410 [Pirellulaceae bacterium]|jgi:hypothetical protein|nr:hypothetical protein [Pirellulaceae bacterium]